MVIAVSFKDSNIPTYQKIWNYILENPDVMTSSNEEGVDRVEKENYAFLMESTTIEYIVERRCSLTQVGGLLDDKGYGIAMKKGIFSCLNETNLNPFFQRHRTETL